MTPILYMQNFSGPVRAVLLTVEALGLKVQQKLVDLSVKEHFSEGYLKLNPQHTIPTLDDHGVVMWDSHAISAYLVDKYGKDDSLYPKDLAKRALVDQRLHFDSGIVFSWLRNIGRGMKYKGRRSLNADQIEGVETGYEHLNNFLRGTPWVAGNSVTIADFALIANVTSLDFLHPINGNNYPNIITWIKRAETLPYYYANSEGLESFKQMFRPLMSKN